MRRHLAAWALLIAAAGLGSGCVARRDVIGPYVRSISRDGPFLLVEYCEIVLGDGLSVGECSFTQIPVAQLNSGQALPRLPSMPEGAPAPPSAGAGRAPGQVAPPPVAKPAAARPLASALSRARGS